MFGYDHVQQIKKAEVCKQLLTQQFAFTNQADAPTETRVQTSAASSHSGYSFDYQDRKDVYGLDQQQQVLKQAANKELLHRELQVKGQGETVSRACVASNANTDLNDKQNVPSTKQVVSWNSDRCNANPRAVSKGTQADLLMQLLNKRDRLKREELNRKQNQQFEAKHDPQRATSHHAAAADETNKFLRNARRVRQQHEASSKQQATRDSDDYDSDDDVIETKPQQTTETKPQKGTETNPQQSAGTKPQQSAGTKPQQSSQAETGGSKHVTCDEKVDYQRGSLVNNPMVLARPLSGAHVTLQTESAPTAKTPPTPAQQQQPEKSRREVRPLRRVQDILSQWVTAETRAFLSGGDVNTTNRADFAAKYAALGRRVAKSTYDTSKLLGKRRTSVHPKLLWTACILSMHCSLVLKLFVSSKKKTHLSPSLCLDGFFYGNSFEL